ncbi:MAG: dentilisin complex serine proteinase subunit PrtP [Spirochaetaceae bacterium]|nr:dentilisin complex serine proteinase subunit PrtP [Spirochaetaceae bacterium]
MKKYLLAFLIVITLSACQFGVLPKSNSSKGEQPQASPTNTHSAKDHKSIKSIMVKTTSDFDENRFVNAGLVVTGKGDLGDSVWWFLEAADGYATKKVARVSGLLQVALNDQPIADWNDLPKPEKKQNPFLRGVFPDGNNDLDPVDQGMGYSFDITEALKAYDVFGYGNNEVVVAVIDTGINMKHSDLQNVTLYAKSCQTDPTALVGGQYVGDGSPFTEVPLDTNWDTQSGHGTHVSGTMVALGDGNGTNGVAWKNTKLISYQGLGAAGSGKAWSIYGALLDLVNVTDILRKPAGSRTDEEKAKLPSYLDPNYQITQTVIPVNMSLGGSMSNPFAFDVINYALEHNVLPVIAMGNEGTHTNSYPAALPGIISVGACNGKKERAGFSTKGHWITVSAPGSGIQSTETWSNTGHENMSGTSMATPFVTGALGYLLSFDNLRNASPQQIKDLLRQTAVHPKGATHDEEFGYGIINVYNAADRVVNNNIPAKNTFYSELPVIFKGEAFGNTVDLAKINIIDENGKSIVNIGSSTDALSPKRGEPLQVAGLQIGKTYTISANIGTAEECTKQFTVTSSGVPQEVVCEFTEPVLEIATVPNLHYNDGNDKTDTMITLYEIVVDPSTLEATLSQVAFYDYDLLDCLVTDYKSGRYLACIEPYKNAGGNYVFYARNKLDPSMPLSYSGEDIDDAGRTATDPDSHEPDDDPFDVIEAAQDVWNQKLACTLTDGDVDFFYFEVPDLTP